MHHGAQLSVDITLRSAVTSFGAVCPNASTDKNKYHELLDDGRCQLVVVGLEMGGRWSVEALNFIECLASGLAREAAPLLRRSSFLGWRRRWTRVRQFVDLFAS